MQNEYSGLLKRKKVNMIKKKIKRTSQQLKAKLQQIDGSQ